MNQFEDTQSGKYLTFIVQDDIYGLEIKHVVDIIGIQDVTNVPRQEFYIKGVFNLRGKIVPIMDVRKRFNKEEREYDDRTCIVVVEIEGITVGIIVDTVLDVMAIGEDMISAAAAIEGVMENEYIFGIAVVEDRSIIILECVNLLELKERGFLADELLGKAGEETA